MSNLIEKLSAVAVIVVIALVLAGLVRLVFDNIWYVVAVIGALVAALFLYGQTKKSD